MWGDMWNAIRSNHVWKILRLFLTTSFVFRESNAAPKQLRPSQRHVRTVGGSRPGGPARCIGHLHWLLRAFLLKLALIQSQHVKTGSTVPGHSPLTRPHSLSSPQVRPTRRGGGARCGSCDFRHVAWSCAFVLVFMIVPAASMEARAGDQKNCREQRSVQELLRRAKDAKQPYQEQRKAYESAVRVCSQEGSLYVALSALLLEHHDAEAALTWAHRGLQIAPGDQELTVYEGISLLLVGHPDQALAVLKIAPATGRNQFYLGMAYRALREHKEAQLKRARSPLPR